jgi:hypothetical protein
MSIAPHPKGLAFKVWKAIMHPPKKSKPTEKERKANEILTSGEIGRFRKY